MDARIQQRIAPPEPRKQRSLNDLNVSQSTSQKAGDNGVDFKNLLLNSNREVQKKREAEKSGDLSTAKNYKEFLDALNKQTDRKDLPKNVLGKDDFLNLFVTQLQNQDPLNPKDGAEMASQLAQFNSLEQMLNVNKTLTELSTKTEQGQSLDFVHFIGKEVSIKAGRLMVDKGALSNASYKVEHPVGRSRLEVRNSSGQLVSTQELGALDAGKHELAWDGLDLKGEKVPDGLYSFTVTAYGQGDSEVPVEITSRVEITGVDMQGPQAGFYTQLGKIGLGDIAEVGERGFVAKPMLAEPIVEKSAGAEAALGALPAAQLGHTTAATLPEPTPAPSKALPQALAHREAAQQAPSRPAASRPERIQVPFTATEGLQNYRQQAEPRPPQTPAKAS